MTFMAEFPRRFAPATLRLKELIATRLGAPRLIFCHKRLHLDETSQRGTVNPSRSEFVEQIDWCRYVVDREPSQRDVHRLRFERQRYAELSLHQSGISGVGR